MNFVLVYRDTGEIAGMDHNSGGYPFRAWSLGTYHYWTDKAEALNYVRMFPELELKEFHWDIRAPHD